MYVPRKLRCYNAGANCKEKDKAYLPNASLSVLTLHSIAQCPQTNAMLHAMIQESLVPTDWELTSIIVDLIYEHFLSYPLRAWSMYV